MFNNFDGMVKLSDRGQLPPEAGLYFILDENSVCLYIGAAENIYDRVYPPKHHKLSQIPEINNCSVGYLLIDRQDRRLAQEKEYIQFYKPKYNDTYTINEADLNVLNIGAKVSANLKSRAEAAAASCGKTLSEFTRDIIINAIEKYETPQFKDAIGRVFAYLSKKCFVDKDQEAKALIKSLIDIV